jgi:hypothetical protein
MYKWRKKTVFSHQVLGQLFEHMRIENGGAVGTKDVLAVQLLGESRHEPAETRVFSPTFPYVCPEPVLARVKVSGITWHRIA